MDQRPEILLLINTLQREASRLFSVCHDAIVRPHDAGKKTKPNDALAVFMLKTFKVDERNFSFYNGLQHFLVMGLLFSRMRKEQVGFILDQILNRYFFNTKKNIAFTDVFYHFNTGSTIFRILETPGVRLLNQYAYIRKLILYPFALRRGKHHPVIRRYLSFFDQNNVRHVNKLEERRLR